MCSFSLDLLLPVGVMKLISLVFFVPAQVLFLQTPAAVVSVVKFQLSSVKRLVYRFCCWTFFWIIVRPHSKVQPIVSKKIYKTHHQGEFFLCVCVCGSSINSLLWATSLFNCSSLMCLQFLHWTIQGNYYYILYEQFMSSFCNKALEM